MNFPSLMDVLWGVFALLVFPGFLFTVAVGVVASWIDRKVTARVQYRVGPPLLQPLYDVLKLFGKETILPRGANKWVFLGAPIVGVAAITLFTAMVGSAVVWPGWSFAGDLIVALYLLVIPSLMIIAGAAASGNPIASVGASREMKMMLGYELPLLLAVGAVLVMHDGALKLGDLFQQQARSDLTPMSATWVITTILCLLAVVFTIQAKLGLVPFDAAEAETELMGGIFVEYSGVPFGLFKLMKVMMLWAVPFFAVAMFWGASFASPLAGVLTVLKYVALLVIITLMRNTNPRLRIQHAVRFLWEAAGLAALAGILVAFLGKTGG